MVLVTLEWNFLLYSSTTTVIDDSVAGVFVMLIGSYMPKNVLKEFQTNMIDFKYLVFFYAIKLFLIVSNLFINSSLIFYIALFLALPTLRR